MTDTTLATALTPNELANRWRCRPATIRAMIRTGELAAFRIGDRVRIAPETIRAAETVRLAVRPVKRRQRRETISKEVRELLDV